MACAGMSMPSRKEERWFDDDMRDERKKRRGDGDEEGENVGDRREKASGDGICEVVNRVYIDKRGGDTSYLAHFIRMSDGEVGHEIGAMAFGEGTNDALIITTNENICIANTHNHQCEDGKLNGNPF